MASQFRRSDSTSFQTAVIVGDKRITRSLKTKDAAVAGRVGPTLQRLADKAATATQRQLLRLVEDILDAAGVPVPWEKETAPISFSGFAREYILRKTRGGAPGSIRAIERAVALFTTHCKDASMTGITHASIESFYDAMIASGLAASTANARMDNLAALFRRAHNMGVIPTNPARDIERETMKKVAPREALPDEDFGKLRTHLLCLDDPAANSWLTAALLGRYCGLRLQDAANLRCDAASVVAGVSVLSYRAGKTGRLETVPILHADLATRLQNLPVGTFVCPALAGKTAPTLSRQFSALLEAAGVVSPVVTTASSRTYRQFSFHSLRHSFRSWLAKLGVPENLSMQLCGHTSARVHAGYDHSTVLDLHNNVAKYFTV